MNLLAAVIGILIVMIPWVIVKETMNRRKLGHWSWDLPEHIKKSGFRHKSDTTQ